MEGHRKDLMDDKLPHRQMVRVELADAVIRIYDLAGRTGYDIVAPMHEKLEYNAKRADHKPENRVAAGGKKYRGPPHEHDDGHQRHARPDHPHLGHSQGSQPGVTKAPVREREATPARRGEGQGAPAGEAVGPALLKFSPAYCSVLWWVNL